MIEKYTKAKLKKENTRWQYSSRFNMMPLASRRGHSISTVLSLQNEHKKIINISVPIYNGFNLNWTHLWTQPGLLTSQHPLLQTDELTVPAVPPFSRQVAAKPATIFPLVLHTHVARGFFALCTNGTWHNFAPQLLLRNRNKRVVVGVCELMIFKWSFPHLSFCC